MSEVTFGDFASLLAEKRGRISSLRSTITDKTDPPSIWYTAAFLYHSGGTIHHSYCEAPTLAQLFGNMFQLLEKA